MGRVAVTLNNRSYRLNCGDGEEQRITALADHIRQKMEAVITEFGQVGEERLLLMAALLVTDELFDLRDRLADDDAGAVVEPDAPPLARSEASPPETARLDGTEVIASSTSPATAVVLPDPLALEEKTAQSAPPPEPRYQDLAVKLNSRFAKQALSSRKPLQAT